MGISERKEREKLEMRRKIVDVAKDLFIQEGFEKTSIRHIAEKIEYSPATIYLYFKDKTEIFQEIMLEAFQLKLDIFNKVMKQKDPVKRLYLLGDAYVHFAFKYPELYDLMFIIRAPMEHINTSKDWILGNEVFNCLYTTVEELISKGKIKFNDPYVGSLAMWSMVHGVASLKIRNRMMMFPDEHIEGLIMASIHQTIDGLIIKS